MKIALVCLSHGDHSCTSVCYQFGLTASSYNKNFLLERFNFAIIRYLQLAHCASVQGAKQKEHQHI